MINPYRSPSSVAAEYHSTGSFRFAMATVWLLGVVVFVISSCIVFYLEGIYCLEIDCPRFLDVTCLAALVVALAGSVAYPGTAGQRFLHFFATCAVLVVLFCFTIFFSMAFLGFDIMD